MEEERSYIIEQVIPEFKEKASEHGVDVSVIDLRWGITEEESRNGKVLEICLRHIDNCRPLFIGIVGDRYGWCPSPEDFFNNDDLKSNFPEIKDYFNKGMSITEIEMQYGAINTQKETDAIFFIRKNENQHFPINKENEKVDSLRKQILQDDKILSYEYKKEEFTDGFSCGKFRNTYSDGSNPHGSQFVDMDYFLMRSAEAYLIAAEADARINSGTTSSVGTEYINALRRRANADASATRYTTEQILDERAKELYYEGFRRTDLVRYGLFGGPKSNTYLWDYKGSQTAPNGAGFEAYRNIFAIPAEDLNANPKLKQNDGYN